MAGRLDRPDMNGTGGDGILIFEQMIGPIYSPVVYEAQRPRFLSGYHLLFARGQVDLRAAKNVQPAGMVEVRVRQEQMRDASGADAVSAEFADCAVLSKTGIEADGVPVFRVDIEIGCPGSENIQVFCNTAACDGGDIQHFHAIHLPRSDSVRLSVYA